MNIEELYRYAYVKRPLQEVYPNISDVPPEFLLEWFKDAFDRQRAHSEEEIIGGGSATPAAILDWLEEAAALTWEAKKVLVDRQGDRARPGVVAGGVGKHARPHEKVKGAPPGT